MKKHELLKKAYDEYTHHTTIYSTNATGQTNTISGKYEIDDFGNVSDVGCGKWIVYNNDSKKWAEIVNPKIAVKVDNDKEFKALMKYYNSMGWKWNGGDNPGITLSDGIVYPENVVFHDKFYMGTLSDCQIIPFSDFAKEHNIKLPLITSEDGVDLFEGDLCWIVFKSSGDWYIEHEIKSVSSIIKFKNTLGEHKLFKDKQAALSWIEAQKPKIIKVDLYFGLNAHIFNETGEVHIFCKDNLLARLSTGDILDIKSSIQ